MRRWHGKDGVVHVELATETGAFYMVNNATSTETIHRSLALAGQYDLRISNHVGAGSPSGSIQQFASLTGGGDIDYLQRLQALSPRWLFVHGVLLSDRELDLIAETGGSLALCTTSGAFRGVGFAPLRKILARGINVGLGTDGAYSAGSLDVVQQMRITALVHNALNAGPPLVTAERAIEMATVNAAAAVGLQGEIGSLEAGKRADISVFDVTRPPVRVNGDHVAVAQQDGGHGAAPSSATSTKRTVSLNAKAKRNVSMKACKAAISGRSIQAPAADRSPPDAPVQEPCPRWPARAHRPVRAGARRRWGAVLVHGGGGAVSSAVAALALLRSLSRGAAGDPAGERVRALPGSRQARQACPGNVPRELADVRSATYCRPGVRRADAQLHVPARR